jgi:carbonic anhydrase
MRIRNHPLVPHDIPIYGYIYDVKTGQLLEAIRKQRLAKQYIC